jgi:hypothetical protein
MKLVGANPAAPLSGVDELPGKANYFIGNDPKKWRRNVPTYTRVRYEEVYPGIDLEFYGTQQGQLEYDFVVAPGADPRAIRLALAGAEKLELDGRGNLHVALLTDEVRFHKPVLYQEFGGERQEVAGSFNLAGTEQVGFEVGDYDRTRPLIIDPVLAYSTYLGGGGMDHGGDIAVDTAGNTYVVGSTTSTNFPTASPLQGTHGGGSWDVFIAKLNAAGNGLGYSTYLGGNDRDAGGAIAVDAAGNVYVTGDASSTNFPTVDPLQPNYGGAGSVGFGDAFVAKLNPTGSALVYSTYLGGSGDERGLDIAVDTGGSAYTMGTTESTNFPTVNPLQAANAGSKDAFVAKLNAAGSALVYSTYLGGSGYETFGGGAIAVDAAGNAYLASSTNSSDFPTANALQSVYGGGSASTGFGDAFITKVNATGSALVYSTYLGGNDDDRAYGIAVDATGNAYVTGRVGSTNFPTQSPLQGSHAGGGGDVFVTKLNSAGSALVYSTYLGGADSDYGRGITVDAAGNTYLTGSTYSASFPTAEPLQPTKGGNEDAFVAKLNAAGSQLVYSTYLGGSGYDNPNGIVVDSVGNAYVTGITGSINFPTANAFQASNAGSNDTFIAKIGEPAEAGVLFGVTACCPNQLVSIDPESGDLTVVGTIGDSSARFATGAATVDASSDRLFLAERSSHRGCQQRPPVSGGAVQSAPAHRRYDQRGDDGEDPDPGNYVPGLRVLDEYAVRGDGLLSQPVRQH